ncbi:type VII secretion protein EssA [Metabacillus sp. HB246100]
MKRRHLVKVFLCLVILTLYHLAETTQVYGETTIDELEPNDYQKNKGNKEYKLNQQQSNQRSSIPEEQKTLTFEGEKVSNDDQVLQSLFSSEVKNSNTIKAKAEGLGLFSSEEKVAQSSVEDSVTSKGSPLTLLIIVLVSICMLLLIVILVVWGKSLKQEVQKR